MVFRKSTVVSLLLGGITTLLPVALAQSTGGFGGYTLGFIFDSRVSALRALTGIPGAAILGAPLDAGAPVRQGFVAPRQNYAIALMDSGAAVVQLISASDPPTVTPLGIDSTAAGMVAFSPNGAAAAIYIGDDSA